MTDTASPIPTPSPPTGAVVPAVSPKGGSVQQTTNVALPLTGGIAVAMWLVHPNWPPPEAIMLIIMGWLAPPAHLIGRAIMRKLTAIAGPDTDGAPNA